MHLRIRPSTLPFLDPSKYNGFGKTKMKVLVDGRWTLAFREEQVCKTAHSMVIEAMNLQQKEVERLVNQLLEIDSLNVREVEVEV